MQDRSIEFWRSLPTSHVQSVGATGLTHLLVLPAVLLLTLWLGIKIADQVRRSATAPAASAPQIASRAAGAALFSEKPKAWMKELAPPVMAGQEQA